MDTIDSSRSNLPAHFSAPLPLQALSAQPLSGELATASMPQVNSRVLLRGLTRHWWLILLLWLVVSVPMAYFIYLWIEPTYEAFSTIRIEPTQPELFERSHNSFVETRSVRPYLETQVNVINSDKVLEQAVANPQVVNLSVIKQSEDPKADLRKRMSVVIIDNAYMIRVALELPDAIQAATIVNSVVEAYMAQNTIFNRSFNKNQQVILESQLTKLQGLLAEKTKEMEKMASEGKFTITKPQFNRPNSALPDESDGPTFSEVTEAQYQTTLAQLQRVDYDLLESQASLQTLEENAEKRAIEQENAKRSGIVNEQLEARIREEFNKDPEVDALSDEITKTTEQRDRSRASTRSNSDPAVVRANQHLRKLEGEWNDLWQEKYTEILERIRSGGSGDLVREAETIRELKIKIESLKKRREGYVKMLEIKLVDSKKTNKEHFSAILLNYELNSLLSKRESISKNLDQLKFEAEQDTFRVMLQDKAAVPKIASNNKRLKYMAAGPLAILFMMLGLFLVKEVWAERVADPDSLSTRVRSEVFALPLLPTPGSMRKLSAAKADEQIDQFIQRLEHLRYALCGSGAELGKGRCVMITSAIGGEGKTTLAAQLAARCGDAGMSTLLIDADLRRAKLCTVLDVPEGPGLSDVLKDEFTLDEVIVPIQGGAFYLLRAGNPIHDASRVLQSRNFELLMGQLRERYELIIIDSPPVLPVHDALILGRWADGAVLAARYDISRFPQVERARRQLDSAGIAILGTVINGMKHSEAYYGSYSYSRRRPSPSDSPNTI
jgi:succinoglycan biosynthesis transport protein ExoP